MSIVYFRFAARASDAPERSPLIESLLTRAAPPVAVADWRADAFRVLAPVAPPPVGAAAFAAGAPAGAAAAWACVATPVHLRAGMTQVTLPANGITALDPDEAAVLVADFNRVFDGSGTTLSAGRGEALLCAFDTPLDVRTHDPAGVAGRDVWDFLPSGADGPRLKRLMSEIEMWLFDHPVNRRRVTQSRQVLSGLWMWGGGDTRAPMPVVNGWTAGADPLFAAFGGEPRWPGATDRGALQSGVVVCAEQPGSAGWGEVEREWLAPAAAALAAGAVRRVDLSAGDWRCSVAGGRRVRFWRRSRPWWEFFGMTGGTHDRE